VEPDLASGQHGFGRRGLEQAHEALEHLHNGGFVAIEAGGRPSPQTPSTSSAK